MSKIKSNFEVLVERLGKTGKIEVLSAEEHSRVLKKLEDDLLKYDREDKVRMMESEKELANIVLTD